MAPQRASQKDFKMDITDLGLGKNLHQVDILGETFNIYTYVPAVATPQIFFCFHGTARNADDYRDRAIEMADREGCVVFAPEFDSARWDNSQYHRGGLVANGVLAPEEDWTVRFVPAMIDWAQSITGLDYRVTLWGHSAGGQFLSRVAAYATNLHAENIVISNPSTYVLPDTSEGPDYSFGGLPSQTMADALIKQYLERPVTIYLGDEDTGTSNLTMTDEAQRQGANRLDRGLRTFHKSHTIALDAGYISNWNMIIADGIGHSSSGMLSAPEMGLVMLTDEDYNAMNQLRIDKIIQQSETMKQQLEAISV